MHCIFQISQHHSTYPTALRNSMPSKWLAVSGWAVTAARAKTPSFHDCSTEGHTVEQSYGCAVARGGQARAGSNRGPCIHRRVRLKVGHVAQTGPNLLLRRCDKGPTIPPLLFRERHAFYHFSKTHRPDRQTFPNAIQARWSSAARPHGLRRMTDHLESVRPIA